MKLRMMVVSVARAFFNERRVILLQGRRVSVFLVRPYSQPFFKAETVSGVRSVERQGGPMLQKQYRLKVSDYLRVLADPKLAPLRAAVKEMGDVVKSLKEKGAPKNEIHEAVVELKARKKKLEEEELALAPKEASFDRLKLENLIKQRFFYDHSFPIYGGVSGLYDLGPLGCALKVNILSEWRKHFVFEESMLEVECTALTPEPVLKASGHVDRFSDWMVKDVKTGECFRADHLIKNQAEKTLAEKKTSAETRAALEDVLARLEGFDEKDMQEVLLALLSEVSFQVIKRFNWKSPTTGNDLTEPMVFDLMFSTQIGTTGDSKVFLRPETAQGIFANFKRLLEFNQGRLPFAAAQIGLGFRNEVSPRQGLIRVREFTMCEVEHFVDPDNKRLAKFAKVRDYPLTLFSACNQVDGQPAESLKIGEAVDKKLVNNETLGYYMARVHSFLVKIGVDPKRLRFRQHLGNEMAHYAEDCWDAEILTSYGWIECVGIADRACYDLHQHHKATGVKLVAERKLPAPKEVAVVEAQPAMAVLEKSFKKDAKRIQVALAALSEADVEALEKQLQSAGSYELAVDSDKFTLTKEMIKVQRIKKTVHAEEIVPSVIEPSFGIGRIMYAVLEHAFRVREGNEHRIVLMLKPLVAPIKCSVLPISSNKRFEPLIDAVHEELAKFDISHKVDDSAGSLGRRYVRTDEIGIPFGVTVDFDSEEQPHTVTLRENVSMGQIRLEIGELGQTVSDLITGRLSWSEAQQKFPKFEAKAD